MIQTQTDRMWGGLVKHNYELRREGWGGITFGGCPIEVRVQLTFVNGGEGGRGGEREGGGRGKGGRGKGGAPTNFLCLSYFFGCLSSDKYFPVRNRDLRF